MRQNSRYRAGGRHAAHPLLLALMSYWGRHLPLVTVLSGVATYCGRFSQVVYWGAVGATLAHYWLDCFI